MLVYVHFPYCLAKCPYCDFASYATTRPEIPHKEYADAVLAELNIRAAHVPPGASVTSIFFGGGTPSLWQTAELGRVVDAVRRRFSVSSDLEVTAECNPTSLDREKAVALLGVGVNRLSIGTQSLRADALKYLGRLHDPDGARAAVKAALSVPGLRVSTDIIFGLPEQSPADACDQARELVSFGLSHLSCYQLTIEPGTPFGTLARRGKLPLADDGMVADSFLALDEMLTGEGFGHYEISNYARPGEESRHNLGYWKGDDYLGLGCAAYGALTLGRGRVVRYRNTPDPARYMEEAKRVRGDAIGIGDGLSLSSEELDGEALLRERIMLGLRLQEGLDLVSSAEQLGVSPWPKERRREADGLIRKGRLVEESGRVRVPRDAWIWADDTAARLF